MLPLLVDLICVKLEHLLITDFFFPSFISIELTVFEKTKEREGDKRKRKKNPDAADIEGFLGPWGGFIDEKKVLCPSEVFFAQTL